MIKTPFAKRDVRRGDCNRKRGKKDGVIAESESIDWARRFGLEVLVGLGLGDLMQDLAASVFLIMPRTRREYPPHPQNPVN